MKKIIYFSRDFIFTIAGIICIGGLPSLFHGISIDFVAYWASLKSLLNDLLHLHSLQYMPSPGRPSITRDMFPEILEPVIYSITLLIGALIISFLIALLGGYIIVLGGKKRIERSQYGVSLFEGIPDLFIIIMIQYAVVWFYQRTDILLFHFVPSTDNKIYILPILLLSIIPAVHLFRLIIQSFENEFDKDYVMLAKSKGSSQQIIILIHVVRNTLITLSTHLRPIIWILLSTLFVVEYMLGIYGVTAFIFDHLSSTVITVSLSLLYIPFFIIFVIVDLMTTRWKATEVAP